MSEPLQKFISKNAINIGGWLLALGMLYGQFVVLQSSHEKLSEKVEDLQDLRVKISVLDERINQALKLDDRVHRIEEKINNHSH